MVTTLALADRAVTRNAEWTRRPFPAEALPAWKAVNGEHPPPECYQHRNGLSAMVGRERWADGTRRWHVSLRFGNPGVSGRVPSWDELVDALHALRPGVPFVIGVPPRSWWMNVHPDVLHAWETRDQGLINEWRQNAEAAHAIGVNRDR